MYLLKLYSNILILNMTNRNDIISISDDVKVYIVRDLVEPAYKTDVKNMIEAKRCWRLTGHIFETISKILVALGGIFSFSAGYYEDPILSFIAGSITTISLAMLQFASFAYKENKKQTQELNNTLTKLGIETIPDVPDCDLTNDLNNSSAEKKNRIFFKLKPKITNTNTNTNTNNANPIEIFQHNNETSDEIKLDDQTSDENKSDKISNTIIHSHNV